MKSYLKTIISASGILKIIFIKTANLRLQIFDKRASKINEFSNAKNHKKVFDFIYDSKYWYSDESVSGYGSTLEITEKLRPQLEKFIKDYEIKSILDVPCGDFNWMKSVNINGAKYTGGDIVSALIDKLNANYKNDHYSFRYMDVITDALPTVDVIFVRDCFIHLSNELVIKSLDNIKKSGSKYLLTTHYPSAPVNVDIGIGQFREVNLCRGPFNLPKPLMIINEGCTDPLLRDKSMGLWEISQL